MFKSILALLREVRKKANIKEIFMPGEIEYNRLKSNMENGIELKDNVYAYLEKIAKEYNIIDKNKLLNEII